MPKKSSGALSGINKCGIRSPMNPFYQNPNIRIPGVGMTETIKGTSPKPAKIISPTKSKATGD